MDHKYPSAAVEREEQVAGRAKVRAPGDSAFGESSSEDVLVGGKRSYGQEVTVERADERA